MDTQIIKNHRINILGDDNLEVWIQSFLSDRKSQNLAKGTLYFYQGKLKTFLKYADSQAITNVSQISPPFIRDFILFLEQSNHNEGGVSTYYRSLKTFLRWYWEEVEPEFTNPISKVKTPRVSIEPLQGITKEKFDILVAACPRNDFLGERDRTILNVLYDTGIRAEELCNIKITDVSLAENWILISHGKGRKMRLVFFGKTTRKQIRRYMKLRITNDS
ncbi:MAG TPA: tyrosine-type recombinase/integrase, partial [Anaerolineales bacterium]|nr:tyrosine-type recombinase/integrase [Anaerolineales bacterium]